MTTSVTALLPPFDPESALLKTRLIENVWNTKDPEKVSLAYTTDSQWRNRSEFISGRESVVQFLQRKWTREREFRLLIELWAYWNEHIAVRFAYEWQDEYRCWFRAYGNESWEFNSNGLIQRRSASINDLPINETQRKLQWPDGPRPDDHQGLSELGL